MKRVLAALCRLALCVSLPPSLSGQAAIDWSRPERSIRRDIPLTNMIRRALEAGTLVVTYPVDVWFAGRKTFEAELPLDVGSIESITLDPRGRFPDRDPTDNVWPRGTRSVAEPGHAAL